MSVPCSDPEYRLRKMKDARLPEGVKQERCWCEHLVKVKESIDFSTCMGMEFFMCANYDASLPRQASSSYEKPLWYHWIDMEQPSWAVKEIHDGNRVVWVDFHADEHAEKMAGRRRRSRRERAKKTREERARNREINRKRMAEEEERRYAEERVRKETREAERKRLRERVVEAQAVEEHGDKTGKYPR